MQQGSGAAVAGGPLGEQCVSLREQVLKLGPLIQLQVAAVQAKAVLIGHHEDLRQAGSDRRSGSRSLDCDFGAVTWRKEVVVIQKSCDLHQLHAVEYRDSASRAPYGQTNVLPLA
jgi:hypothetical protein